MKLKYKILTLCFGVIFLGSLKADVFEWDFSKGINPLNSKMKFTISEKFSEIKDGFLWQTAIGKPNPGGIFAQQKYQELTPNKAFKISFVISFEAARSKEVFLFLWDSKGDYLGDTTTKALKNSGFTVAFYRHPNSKAVTPRAWLGFGKSTFAIKGKPFTPEIGKKYILEFSYNGTGLASFYVDGKLNKEVNVTPGGSIAPALYKVAIGNRAVGNYFGFDGKIYSVKLTTIKD